MTATARTASLLFDLDGTLIRVCQHVVAWHEKVGVRSAA